ncbi:MAG: enolase C-terminal domain-like protein [Planctomycetia bacterium]|nr:enolase C-terminal domain-like protein [Planctomycetia bacterium]
MWIDRIDVFLVRLPLASPFVIADTVIDHCDTVYLRLESEGCSGWGEITPGNHPYLTSAWSQGVYFSIRENLIPLIAKTGYVEDGDKLDEIFAPVKGNRHAKAAFDLALWDLIAKKEEKPLWKALGGSKKPIEVGFTFDREKDPDLFYKQLFRVFEEGYQRITLKLRPGWDLQVVGAVRAEAPALMKIQIDPEGALDLESQSEILYRLEDFMPSLLEQPLNQTEYVGHAMLQDQMHIPIGLDEAIKTLPQANIAFDLQCAEVFSMKTGRVGGLTTGKKIHDAAKTHDVVCYGGFDIQSSLAYRHLLALSSLPNFTLPCDYIRFDEVFQEEPVPPILSYLKTIPNKNKSEEGQEETLSFRAVDLWDEPGIGVEPDPAILEKHLLDRVSWFREK